MSGCFFTSQAGTAAVGVPMMTFRPFAFAMAITPSKKEKS